MDSDAVLALTRAGAPYRYGAVFLILLVLLVVEIVAPGGTAERAIAVALAGLALVTAVATARRPTAGLERLVLLVCGLVVVGIAASIVSATVTHVVLTLLLVAVPVTLVRGLLRLIDERGVEPQAIAGGLAIYLVLGLLFASVIGFITAVSAHPYFANGSDATNGIRVYFSFTTLTTTGFGDYTAATAVGHALAVLEMLSGQLYLVTVLGVLIGHYAGRRR